MLTIRKENFREDEINVVLDGLVPKNHLVRKIENTIDFSFIYDKVKDLYSLVRSSKYRSSCFNKNSFNPIFIRNSFDEANN